MLGDIGPIAAGLVNAPGDDALCVDALKWRASRYFAASLRFGIVGVVQGVGILGDQTRQRVPARQSRVRSSRSRPKSIPALSALSSFKPNHESMVRETKRVEMKNKTLGNHGEQEMKGKTRQQPRTEDILRQRWNSQPSNEQQG